MNFNDYNYQRPDLSLFKMELEQGLDSFKNAENSIDQIAAFQQVTQKRADFDTMMNICHIRHTIDTTDSFYEAENDYFDTVLPEYQELVNQFYDLLLTARFRPELEAKFGKQLFVIAELVRKTFEPDILSDLQEENKLTSEYSKLNASSQIEFQGKVYNVSGLAPFEQSKDRDTRLAAATAKWGFYAQHEAEFDRIYDGLVKVRHRIAQKLGYTNFVELGYTRMIRSDYNADMVAVYRRQILQEVVPIVVKLRARQAKRLGLEKLEYYDEPFKFQTGNPVPKGAPAWIVENARKMYSELSEETRDFFNFMMDNNLMDLENKPSKSPGGYCTFIAKHKAPYIFSNFNGTSHDIDVLTHEAGHAFQAYESRQLGVSEYSFPTYEAAEIHSMSMEFLTWNWMELFFKEDTAKYKFMHIESSLSFLPYGVAVDEFQHIVYENPDLTPAERRKKWREVERKYMPDREYTNNEYLQNGGFWQRQGHIFASPFYYIDYTLAQICAFQFWQKDNADHAATWEDYLRLCRAGGSLPFLELVKLANLKSPFDPSCVKSVVTDIAAWLENIDDSTF